MMKRLLVFALVALVTWKGYEEYSLRSEVKSENQRFETVELQAEPLVPMPPPQEPTATASAIETVVSINHFSCDGRTHCSQMSSCAEATYFLQNCPDIKMDGDGDGVPCEDQLCGH